jgi:hypothetical protein
MEPEDYIEDHDDQLPTYRSPAEIDQWELTDALRSLCLFDDDMYLRMQAFNLAIVDEFITTLEYAILRKQFDEEPIASDAAFLSAQSQMWIFAAYELLRTWRERAKEVLKLAANGGIRLKIQSLEKDRGFLHVGRAARADQLKRIEKDPALLDRITEDIRLTHIPFKRLEYIRVALAKHEVGGRKKSVAYAPGYGRINRWCGSLEYQIEADGAIMGDISRRDIAEELRALRNRDNLPTDEDIASFDEFMKGPPII